MSRVRAGYTAAMDTGNTHGPRVDDEMAHEVHSLTSGAPVESRAEEARAMEDGGYDEPVAESVVSLHEDAADTRGLTRSETRARSELARHLRPSIFPARRDAIVECAQHELAPPELIAELRALPDIEFPNLEAVWEAVGGRRETRGGDERPTSFRTVSAGPTSDAPSTFRFRFEPLYRLAAVPFRISDNSASVVVDQRPGHAQFTARFGPWRVATDLYNIASVSVTGPYAAWRTMGPPRVSLADRGLTMATNHRRGVCIQFRHAVAGVEPLGVIRHPGITVTVDDVEGLVEMLEHVIARFGARSHADLSQ
jgi:hypothetical protein